jgi:hypothetical protein
MRSHNHFNFRTFALRKRRFTLGAGGFLGGKTDSAVCATSLSIGNGFAFSVAITADGLAHADSVVGKGRQSTTPEVTT